MIFCSELSFPEGPVVVVEMGVESGCITHIGPKGDSKRVIAKTGRPNAFGPDGNLYVNETLTGMVYRYAWRGGGEFGPRECFGQSNPDPILGYQGPDGMAFSQDGRLYVAIFKRGRVAVMDADGRVVENVATRGQKPTNVAFGLPGDKRIYVTENEFGALEVFDAGVDGLSLYC